MQQITTVVFQLYVHVKSELALIAVKSNQSLTVAVNFILAKPISNTQKVEQYYMHADYEFPDFLK